MTSKGILGLGHNSAVSEGANQDGGEATLLAEPSGTKDMKMEFDPNTIDHLGIRLYSQLPAALNELVTNGYDADSATVEITVPVGTIQADSEIKVVDRGNGMSREDVRTHYLIIGRNRREDVTQGATSPNGRKATGRKGLGKLAAFGVAESMELRTVKGGVVTAIVLNYNEMKATMGKYRPTFLADDGQETDEPAGTTITLKGLKRKSDVRVEDLIEGLGRRLTLIDPDFIVTVNGQPVESAARHDREDCETDMVWNVSDIPTDAKTPMPAGVSGWFGFVRDSKQTERGVNIYANRKAAEVGSFFNYSGTTATFARAYLVGEIHADFLDGADDLIATARNEIVWEDPRARVLEDWGQYVLRWLFNQWTSKRRDKRKNEVYDGVGFQEWLKTRTKSERRIAEKALDLIIDDPNMSEDRAKPLVEIVKASVESKAFDELIQEMESSGENVPVDTVLRMFKEWGVIESREFLRIFKGRLEAVERLGALLGSDALEVSVMQPLLHDNLWILDPGWKRADRETHYSKILCEFADKDLPPDEKDRRLDIFAVSASGRISVVEVKRANKVLEKKDMQQIRDYKSFLEESGIGNSNFSALDVDALLIVGEMNPRIQKYVADERMIGIRVMTWDELHRRARQIYEEYEAALQHAAPEYAKQFNASLQPPSTP